MQTLRDDDIPKEKVIEMQVKTQTAFIFEGKLGAPVLVLANSLAAAPQMWDAQVKALSQHYQILRYSYRGHADTPAQGNEANIEDLRQDLLGLLDYLNIQKFSFLGLSLGAMLGLYLAAKNPERVTSLVAANFRPFQIDATKEQWNQRIEAVAKNGINAILDGTADRWLSEGFRKSNPEIDQKVRQMIAGTSADGFIACAKAVRDYDARLFMNEIQCPVLLIAGSSDLAAPVSEFPAVQASIKGSQYLQLDAAHISNIERESEFTDAVLKFLK
ncbi:alpha/beta fold hydrolase [Polynucleobacter sinensis]|uniref:alpha/beta fold hydrolase n=1 Tax=Polynucleobacter sinensis TaxID=1743157 RepID=UPI0007815FA3|nr:alpha/beta fold hydrolase [Polynucleobacter sinensis]